MHAPAGGGGYGAGYGSGQQPILFYSTASGHVQPQITSTAPQVFVSRRQQQQQQQAAASAAASPHLFPLQQPVGWTEPVSQAAVYAHPQYPPSHLAYAPPGPRPSEPYNAYASPYLPQLSASQQHQYLLQQQQQQQQQQMLMQQSAYPPHLFYGPQPTYSPQPQPPVQQQPQQPLQLPQQQTAHQQAYQQPPPQQSTQQQPPRHQPQQQPQQQIPGGLYSPMTPLPQVPQPQLRQDQLNAQGQGQPLQPAAAAGPQRHHLPVIAEVAASATLLAADAQSSLAARRQQRSSSFSTVEQGGSPLLQQPAVPASPGAAIPLSAVAPGSPLDGPTGPVAVSPSPLSAAPFQPSPQNVTQYQALPKMRLQSLPPAPTPASALNQRQTQQNPVVSPRGTDATRGAHPQQQLRKPLPDPVPASVPVSDLGGPALAPDIKKDINMFQLEGYAQHYFRTVKKGLFKRTVPVRELLVWSKGDINGGLLKHAKRETHKAAIKMFRNIQRYMGDREVKAGNRSGDQLALHIAVEADRVPELRDEVYIQICKQTTQNPSPKSNGLGWELLAIISSICYPTKDLEVHLVAYLNFYLGWNEENVRAIAHYCLRKLGQKGRPASLHRAIILQEIVRYKAAPFQKSWFGSCLLEQLEMPVQAPPQTAATDIPLILPALTRAIEVAGGFKTEGLFRISGDGAEVSRLRAQVEGGDLTFNPRACPHDLASLFKAWLRELTPVVIVPELYQEFLNNCDQQPKLRELVAHLPPVHNKVLLHVLRFLQALTHADNVPATKMTASNIALLFSPLLLRCPSDDPMVMLENTKSESKAVATLLQIDWSAA